MITIPDVRVSPLPVAAGPIPGRVAIILRDARYLAHPTVRSLRAQYVIRLAAYAVTRPMAMWTLARHARN
jgi:hypothetical protein